MSPRASASSSRESASASRICCVRSALRRSAAWKGRSLLQGIAEHRSGTRSTEAIELRRSRRETLAERAALLLRISDAVRNQAPSAEVDALRDEARVLLEQAESFAGELRSVSPRDAGLDLSVETSPEELREALLGPGDLFVEFAEGNKQMYAYCMGEGALGFLRLGPLTEVAEERDRFLNSIDDRSSIASPAEVAQAGHALYERLLAPVLSIQEQVVQKLVIVPGASLSALPFEALVTRLDDDEPQSCAEITFVIDRFEVTYGPSSPVLIELAATTTRAAHGGVLVLADPLYASEARDAVAALRAVPEQEALTRLPGTRTEALAIARRLAAGGTEELGELQGLRSGSFVQENITLHLGESAARERLAGDLRMYSVLHLACHGYIDSDLPQRTGLALSPTEHDDGYFTIADALELDLDADLVVLSACQTARGEAKAGEGVESIARAFLYAGARGLVASLWQVDDRAAARTMDAFYKAWLQEGRAPAEALRAAKLAVRRGELELGPGRGVGVGAAARPAAAADVGHPYYWAPFIHIGL